ncbi:MAG: citrate synthase [Proteobacteria bacterium]|nr:citrate synthase [Pseudomonadota bacterium]
MSKSSLTVTDNRTAKTYELEIKDGTVRAMDLRQIKSSEDDFGLMAYDPAFVNTASCKSRITLIDGEKGILRYRGYPIAQLAEGSNFLESSYLLFEGELPNKQQLDAFSANVMKHVGVHESVRKVIDAHPNDAHLMGVLVSSLAALSTIYPDSKQVHDDAIRREHMYRLLAKVPTLAAYAFRHSRGLPYVYPDAARGYSGNYLNMMFKDTEQGAKLTDAVEHALDVLFILHADHEQNCSANAMRSVGSALTDPYCSVAAAAAALYGPLHGGANEAVVRMLTEIGSVDNIPSFIEGCKGGERRLMGFGHRVYKNYDPRATVIKRLAYEVFDALGKNPLIDIALELERIALEDEYFVKRKLYPNVDFYSGIIYQSMGLPVDLFPVLFAVGRTAGWLAQWEELLKDSEQRIARPRQIYLGEGERQFKPLSDRG